MSGHSGASGRGLKEITRIYELGYRQMPEEMYLDWLLSLKEEREKYSNQD